jgi:hypothetical protein
LTPAKAYLAQIQAGRVCTFVLAASDNGSPWVFSLSLRFTLSATDNSSITGKPILLTHLFNTSILSTFDGSYNTRAPLLVPTPAVPPGMKLHAYISAIITGGRAERSPAGWW